MLHKFNPSVFSLQLWVMCGNKVLQALQAAVNLLESLLNLTCQQSTTNCWIKPSFSLYLQFIPTFNYSMPSYTTGFNFWFISLRKVPWTSLSGPSSRSSSYQRCRPAAARVRGSAEKMVGKYKNFGEVPLK